MAKEEPRAVKCEDCGVVWDSQAMTKNLKCKVCKSDNVTDNYIAPIDLDDEIDELEAAQQEAADAQEAAEEATRIAQEKAEIAKSKEPPPCSRCNGDGQWHSLKSGYRARTSTEPLHDPNKACPKCN